MRLACLFIPNYLPIMIKIISIRFILCYICFFVLACQEQSKPNKTVKTESKADKKVLKKQDCSKTLLWIERNAPHVNASVFSTDSCYRVDISKKGILPDTIFSCLRLKEQKYVYVYFNTGSKKIMESVMPYCIDFINISPARIYSIQKNQKQELAGIFLYAYICENQGAIFYLKLEPNTLNIQKILKVEHSDFYYTSYSKMLNDSTFLYERIDFDHQNKPQGQLRSKPTAKYAVSVQIKENNEVSLSNYTETILK